MTISRDLLLRAYPPAPPQVNARIDETLAALHREGSRLPPRRYATRLRFGTVLVALLILLAAIGVAAGIHFGVFDFMEQFFGQTGMLPQAGELVQTDLATLETEHTAITLTQAVYDGGNLRVVYSTRVKGATAPITSEELNDGTSAFRAALAADGVSPWGCDWFSIDGTEYAMTNGSTGAALPGAENGEALCYMDIYLASSGIVPKGDFKVSLPIIRRGRGEVTTLDFTVKADGAASIQPPVRAKGATITVLSASLSPVRAYVNLRTERNEGVSPLEFELLLADWGDAMLVDAQGNPLAALSEFFVSAQEEGESAEYSFTFLPTGAGEAYIAPTVIGAKDHWFADMSQAIQVK
jgi:hypothetical protein